MEVTYIWPPWLSESYHPRWDLGHCDGDPCRLEGCGDANNAEDDVPCCVKPAAEDITAVIKGGVLNEPTGGPEG